VTLHDEPLIDAARAAAERAYAPYSGFHVGAAVRVADGRIFAAANVENASYGLSLCAETNAVAAAVCAGARVIAAVAVVGYPAGQQGSSSLASPCGRCRQVLVEFAAPESVVILASGDGGTVRRFALADLLPHAFGPDALAV